MHNIIATEACRDSLLIIQQVCPRNHQDVQGILMECPEARKVIRRTLRYILRTNLYKEDRHRRTCNPQCKDRDSKCIGVQWDRSTEE